MMVFFKMNEKRDPPSPRLEGVPFFILKTGRLPLAKERRDHCWKG
jgi:hypothetical protein